MGETFFTQILIIQRFVEDNKDQLIDASFVNKCSLLIYVDRRQVVVEPYRPVALVTMRIEEIKRPYFRINYNYK